MREEEREGRWKWKTNTGGGGEGKGYDKQAMIEEDMLEGVREGSGREEVWE